MTLGLDFYELLELFINCDAVTKHSAAYIVENVPNAEVLKDTTEKELRKMIPHWTASKYHTASIDEVLSELQMRIRNEEVGTFFYNSNKNNNNRRAYNDMYVLIVTEDSTFFFDINRRKAYKIRNESRE